MIRILLLILVWVLALAFDCFIDVSFGHPIEWGYNALLALAAPIIFGVILIKWPIKGF